MSESQRRLIETMAGGGVWVARRNRFNGTTVEGHPTGGDGSCVAVRHNGTFFACVRHGWIERVDGSSEEPAPFGLYVLTDAGRFAAGLARAE